MHHCGFTTRNGRIVLSPSSVFPKQCHNKDLTGLPISSIKRTNLASMVSTSFTEWYPHKCYLLFSAWQRVAGYHRRQPCFSSPPFKSRIGAPQLTRAASPGEYSLLRFCLWTPDTTAVSGCVSINFGSIQPLPLLHRPNSSNLEGDLFRATLKAYDHGGIGNSHCYNCLSDYTCQICRMISLKIRHFISQTRDAYHIHNIGWNSFNRIRNALSDAVLMRLSSQVSVVPRTARWW